MTIKVSRENKRYLFVFVMSKTPGILSRFFQFSYICLNLRIIILLRNYRDELGGHLLDLKIL